VGLCANLQAQDITLDLIQKDKAFQYIQVGYSMGYKTYGLENLNLKQQSITSLISAEINVYEGHSIYGEFINQPMMQLAGAESPLEVSTFFNSYYYDIFLRSRGFNVGYTYTSPLSKNIDMSVLAGVGKTYIEFKEYLTNKESLAVQEYEDRDTLWNGTLGVRLNYLLPNNLGLSAEAAIGYNSPILKLGLIYRIKS